MNTGERSYKAVEQKGQKATEGGLEGHRGSMRHFLPGDLCEIGPCS